MKINSRIIYLHKTSRTNNLAIRLFLGGLKHDLATIWYDKFYRCLTVAPHGDGTFLKVSRTSDLYSLGADQCLIHWAATSFTWMIFFCSDNVSSHEKQGNSIKQAFYLPNPTNLTFFLLSECIWIGKLFLQTFYFFESKNII